MFSLEASAASVTMFDIRFRSDKQTCQTKSINNFGDAELVAPHCILGVSIIFHCSHGVFLSHDYITCQVPF